MTKEEGPRSFGTLLTEIAEGDLHAELSGTLHRLNTLLADHATSNNTRARGTLTMVLNLAHEPNGVVSISYDVKTKEPKRVRSGAVFFRTPGNNLSVENPRQTKLPLRDVNSKESAREVPVDEKSAARGV